MESVVYCFYKITLSKTEFAGTINQRFFKQSEHAYYLSYFITLSLILIFSGVGGGCYTTFWESEKCFEVTQ